MKKTLAALFLTGIVLIGKAQQPSELILGIWQNERRNFTVEFYKEGDTYSAKIIDMVSSNGEIVLDKNNPDPKKRNQALIGTVLISNLEFSSGIWENGKIYAPNRGIFLNCKASVIDQKLHITFSKGILSETKIWTRK